VHEEGVATGLIERHFHQISGEPGATRPPVRWEPCLRNCATARRGGGVKGGVSRRVRERTLDAIEQRQTIGLANTAFYRVQPSTGGGYIPEPRRIVRRRRVMLECQRLAPWRPLISVILVHDDTVDDR
jgi:hypothetical protein